MSNRKRSRRLPFTIFVCILAIGLGALAGCMTNKAATKAISDDLTVAQTSIVSLEGDLEISKDENRGINEKLNLTKHKVGVLTENNTKLSTDMDALRADLEILKKGVVDIKGTSSRILEAIENN